MQIQHTPAPFPSTILSLAPSEQFSYKGTTIQAVTVLPHPETGTVRPYTLSGESNVRHQLRTYTLSELPAITPPLVRAAAVRELQIYATPVLRTPAPAPAPRAHLQAVPSLPAHPQPHTPRKGAHRA